MPLRLSFQGGTLRLEGLARGAELPAREGRLAQTHGDAPALPAACVWDEREAVYRAPAVEYAALVLALRDRGVEIIDDARRYTTLSLTPTVKHEPFPYQKAALEAWRAHRSRGVVVLPTGAGKTYVATLAILARQRSALVVVPTLDLMNQWYDVLKGAFAVPVGLVGGSYHEVEDLTVTTYDSAHLHMDRLGNRFGLVIFDECHHLPSPSYSTAARMCLAPYRLGLTATPERADGRTSDDTIGKIVFRKDITELSGEYLAPYETVRLEVQLSPEEREEYERERGIYLTFLRANDIRMASPDGWRRFLIQSSQSDAGRRAFLAHRRQRTIALAAPGKIALLARLLHTHRRDRALIFTQDNASVYAISRRFLIPAITHQTRVKERSAILSAFNEGTWPSVVTSRVLNEGVNVPAANVAIVLSGSAQVNEHVQRLGRILRKGENKQAILYEVVAAGTSEERVSERRREHVAYR